jgi:uncharacterized protein (TIGR02117 family)
MKNGFRILFTVFVSFLFFIIIYLSTAFICSLIPVNEAISKEGSITVYIKSNGVHTDLVVPVKSKKMDWFKIFPSSNTKDKDSTAKFLALGWGDKGFYLNTPTWGDLTFSTAFKAMFGLSTSALHTTYLDTIQLSSTCKKISMTQNEYELLVRYIKRTISTKKGSSIFIPTNAVYGTNDAFYEATGSYHLFSTCNTWTNRALKYSNKKACFWTPFDTGILNQYP